MNYPDDSIQNIIDLPVWWEKTQSQSIERGHLVKAFLPHVDQVPFTIIPKGRKDPKAHDKALVKIRPLDMKHPVARNDLPVAAMSLNDNEIWTAYKAKKRPCLILGKSGHKIKDFDRKGMAKRSYAETLLVVPYYGCDQDGSRGGYKPQFVERVRHMMYSRFFWDMLPLNGTEESLMRFDQMQPVGRISNSYEHTGYKIHTDALAIIDEAFHLYMYGTILTDGSLNEYMEFIKDMFYS